MNTPPRKIPERGLYRPVWMEFNRLIDYVREISPLGGRNLRQTRTLNGTLSVVESGPEQAVGEVRQFRVKTIQNDFYTCRTWNGTTEGSTDVSIARPFTHRVSNFNGQTISWSSDGDVFNATYAYASPTKRTKTVNGAAETQVLIPYFKTDFDLIYAIKIRGRLTIGPANTPLTDPEDAPITLLDMNVDGRAWAKLESVT